MNNFVINFIECSDTGNGNGSKGLHRNNASCPRETLGLSFLVQPRVQHEQWLEEAITRALEDINLRKCSIR